MIEFNHRQQDKRHLSLCVGKRYKNDYFREVKNKINSQLHFLKNNGVEKIDLEQSNISESCYVRMFFKKYKYPAYIRIAGHYGHDEDTIFITDDLDIRNMFHFNKMKLLKMEREIIEEEKDLRSKKMF